MIIRFDSFSKDINSTKKLGKPNNPINCELKGACNLTNPSFTIHRQNFNLTWNYCYIDSWNRYYFVTNITIETGERVTVDLAVDVLATYRNEILASTCYVARSASNFSVKIPDGTWSHTSDFVTESETISIGLDTVGCYLLYVASDDNQNTAYGIPSLCVYAVSPANLKDMCNYMFSTDFFNSATEGLDETAKTLSKTFFNPFQYISKCMWLPFAIDEVASLMPQSINFGWWESPYTARMVDKVSIIKNFSFTLSSYNTWTDRDSTWSHYTMYCPGFGQFDLSPDFAGEELTGKIITDIATGQSNLFIADSNAYIIQSATGQLGADVQLSALYEDLVSDFGTVGSAVSTGIKSAVGGVAGFVNSAIDTVANGGISSLLSNAGGIAESAVTGAQSALQPTMKTVGSSGARGFTQHNPNCIVSSSKYTRLEDVHSKLGGMCCKICTLSDLSGYTEVRNFHIDLPATVDEISMINHFMQGGIYID